MFKVDSELLNKSFRIRLSLVLLFPWLSPVAFLKQLFAEVHECVVEPEQAVTEQEAQVATKVSYQVGGVVDVELGGNSVGLKNVGKFSGKYSGHNSGKLSGNFYFGRRHEVNGSYLASFFSWED